MPNGAKGFDALLASLGLKHLDRAGWVQQGIDPPESVAAHSFGVAWLVLALLPPTLNRARALSYAVLHDLPEAITGDITPSDGVAPAAKRAAEDQAMRALAAPFPQVIDLYQAYHQQADPEARFVHQCDKLDMALQALYYTQQGHRGLAPFVDAAAVAIEHPVLLGVLAQVQSQFARISCGE